MSPHEIRYSRIVRLVPDANAAVPLRRSRSGRLALCQPVRFARWAWAFGVRFMAVGGEEALNFTAFYVFLYAAVLASLCAVLLWTRWTVPPLILAGGGVCFVGAAFFYDAAGKSVDYPSAR